jgi:crotonobetainyl-CoA:carnitine CoA-transferase CaiB-like acyl-CoA transferase
MSGGAKVGNFMIQLVWPAQDGDVAILFLFGPSIGPFTRRFMEWMHEEGFCDTATRDKDWIGLLTQLLTGQESLSEYDRLKRLVGAFTMTKSKAELAREALARGLLIAPVTTVGEVVDSEQLAERDYWRLLDHSEWGRSFRYPGPFAKFSRIARARWGRRCRPVAARVPMSCAPWAITSVTTLGRSRCFAA